MPLDVLEIQHFNGGIVGSADDRDIPVDAASYAENLDPIGEEGKLSGLPTDQLVTDGAATPAPVGGGGKAYTLFKDGTQAVYYHDDGTNKTLKHVTGLGGGVASEASLGVVASNGKACGVADHRAVHFGLGGSSSTPAKWVGEIAHGQFGGAAPSGIQVVDALLDTPNISMPSVTLKTADSDGYFRNGYKYFYRMSVTYDGYQEAPLIGAGAGWNTGKVSGGPYAAVDVELSIADGTLPKRVTHVNLYRAETPDGGSAKPSSDWTLVESVSVETGWTLTAGSWKKTVTDNGVVGQTFERRTGFSSTLNEMKVNYGLSASTEGHHFVALCYSASVSGAENYIFKSKAYRFDTFDWSADFLHLPVPPKAMTSFMGRLFVFAEGKFFIVNPSTMGIEDEYEGIGCIGPDSLVVSDRGLFWADKHGLYLHDGAKLHHVGRAILKNQYDSAAGWLSVNHASGVSCLYDATRDLFLAIHAGTPNRAWAYHTESGRWMLVKLDLDGQATSGAIGGRFMGVDGTPYISLGTNLYRIFKGTGTRPWLWVSRRLTRDLPSLFRKFYHARVTGADASLDYSEDGGPWTASTSTTLGAGVYEHTVNSGQAEVTPAWHRAREVRIRLSSSASVSALGITYRQITPR